MHLLMKPVTDVVYSSLPLEESQKTFQSVLAKQSSSLASASFYHFFIDRVTGDRVTTHLCVWSKGGLEFFSLWLHVLIEIG